MHDEPLMIRIGRRLRAARVATGLTVREAATQLGLSDHSLLVRYENGQNQPPLDRLAQIADAYGLSLAALLAQHDTAVSFISMVDRADTDQLHRLLSLLETEPHPR